MYILLFLLALTIRVVYLVGFHGLNNIPDSDSPEYHAYAVNIAEHGTYTDGVWTVFRAPGYPAFMAGVIKLFGDSYANIQLVQTLLSACIPLLVFRIALLVGGGEAAALTAATIACAQFGLVSEPSHIISEATFTFLYTAILLFTLKSPGSTVNAALTGLAIALAWLTRPVAFTLIPFISLWLILKCGFKDGAKKIIVMTLVIVAVMMPWWIRNYRLHHTFIPSAMQTGYVLYQTNDPHYDMSKYNFMPEIQRDNAFRRDALLYVKSHPVWDHIKMKFKGVLYFFYPFLPAYDIFYMLLVPFCLIGLYFALTRKAIDQWILLTMFMYLPVIFVFNDATRYRHSMMPAYIIISVIGLFEWRSMFAIRKWQGYVFGGWISLNILILACAPLLRTQLKLLFKAGL